MPIQEKEITVIKREFVCDQCKKGVMRLAFDLPIADTNPKQFLHCCSSCKAETVFTVIYPVLVYKEADFMLADSLRFEPREPGVSTSN